MKFLERNSDTKLLEKEVKNKWRWEWLDETDSLGQKYGEWLKKPDAMGMAFCDACGKTISYKSSGKKALRLHSEDSNHRKNLRTVKSNQVCAFFCLSSWKKVVLGTQTLVNMSPSTPPTLFPLCLVQLFLFSLEFG